MACLLLGGVFGDPDPTLRFCLGKPHLEVQGLYRLAVIALYVGPASYCTYHYLRLIWWPYTKEMERHRLPIPKRRAQRSPFDLWVKLLGTLFLFPIWLASFVHWAITDPEWLRSVRTRPMIAPMAVLLASAMRFGLYWRNYTKPDRA